MQVDFLLLQTVFLKGLNELRDFKFSYTNQVFWLFILVLFLVLWRFWRAKKSFSFCWKIAAILLATTALENFASQLVAQEGGSFDPLMLRIISSFIIIFMSAYYFFVSGD